MWFTKGALSVRLHGFKWSDAVLPLETVNYRPPARER